MRPLYSGILREAIAKNWSFLIYALPKEQECTLNISKGNNLKTIELKSENSEDFFFSQDFGDDSFLNFKVDEKLKVKIENFLFDEEIKLKSLGNFKDPNKEDFVKKVESAIKAIKQNEFKKVVLSRPIRVEKNQSLWFSFSKILNQYTHAFRYLYFNGEQLWMGASPELLLKKEDDNFQTMALAGTILPEEKWTNKEIEEQELVVQHIQKNLGLQQIETSPTEDFLAGNVKHLRNFIHWKNSELSFQNYVQKLHPTSAICGMPTENTLKWILKNEGYSRGLYSGLIGFKSENTTQAFVNLRCSQIFDNQIIIYVGAGITEKSSAEKEWQETERKAELLRNIFNN